jgi:hypothetical protein
MSAHDTSEYATADGNDYAAHEGTYQSFLLLVGVGLAYVVNISIALAIGGVKGAWLPAVGILVVATIIAVYDLITGAKVPGYVMVLLSLIALALI